MIHIHVELNLRPFASQGRLGRITEISRDPFKIKTINRQNNQIAAIFPKSTDIVRMIKGLNRD